MATLLCITQKLFQINLFVALVSVVGFVALREQQAMVTDNQQKHLENPLGYHQALKQVSYDYSPSSTADAEKIRRYEQKVQELTQQLKDSQGKATQQVLQPAQVRQVGQKPYYITTLARPEPYRLILKESYSNKVPEKLRQSFPARTTAAKAVETPRTQTQVLIPTINLPEGNPSNLVHFLGNNLENVGFVPWVSSQARQEATTPNRENPLVESQDVIIGYVERVNKGLSVAQEKGEIKYGTRNYNKVQTAIKYMRTTATSSKVKQDIESPEELINQTLEEAAQVSQLPSVDVLKKLSDYADKYEATRQQQQKKLLSSEIAELTGKELIISYANSIAFGLIEADRKGEVTSGTRNYKKVQTAIKYMRSSDTLERASQAAVESSETLLKQTLEEAAQIAQLSSPDVLRRLGKYGQQRPGIPLEVTQIIDNVNE
jgi:hypothetical protein